MSTRPDPATTAPSDLSRRDVVLGGAALGGASLAAAAAASPGPGGLPATARPTSMAAAADEGLRQSVCRWCFMRIPMEELAKAAVSMGLESIEILGPDDFPVLDQHDLICAMVNSHSIPKGINKRENHEECLGQIRDAIDAAAERSYPNVITFSGNRDGQDDEDGLEQCTEALQKIVPYAEQKKVTICMELLNSKVDHADYMCDTTPWGVELVKRVGSDRFKLLYDIYHMQIMEGDVIRTIRDNHEYIGHYHTAGVPGRNEIDDSQELYYPAIMRAIRETGYRGIVGQEFIPKSDDPLASLRDGVRICDV